MFQRLQQFAQANLAALRQKGSFAQNLAVTFSGSAAVTAIGLLLTPVMSRIYPPESYGGFAVFSSLVNNVALASTLTYTWAIVLPKNEKRFLALVQLSILLTLGTLVLLVAGVALLGEPLERWLHAEALHPWRYAIPVVATLFNLNTSLNNWYLRRKEFRKRAGIEVATSLVGRGITIGYGLQFQGALGGLIIGELFNKVTAFISLLRGGLHREMGALYRTFSWARIRSVACEYRDYPLYVLPANYLGVVAAQLPIFMLTSGFGATMVGLYSFSVSLMELPVALLGNSLAPVFQQKAVETHHEHPERLADLCLQLYTKLFYLGLLPFGIVTVFGDWLFKFAFGARWEMAGLFTSYLGYYYVFRLTGIALSPVLALLKRQRVALLSTGALLAVRFAGLAVGVYLHDVRLAMLLFGLGSVAVALLSDLYLLKLLGVGVAKVALRTVGLMAATLLLLKLLRLGLAALLGW
ncbi:lipopolysaccharide biosynthesis protein [Hymenobacter glaciei]|uniref:lipopolysaccharide biosynthesis protein n=1 Tax=Hymenobacter glaciei TaxID=877209 RepID=UPI0031ED346C